MRVLSVQVGQPREIEYQQRNIRTAIFKTAVAGPVRVTFDGLAGDAQADLRVHGGVDKAVYAFSRDAYAGWPLGAVTEPGAFGENLTIDSLDEGVVCLGDQVRIGDCLLEVTQPRQPCYKLNARRADARAVRTFTEYRRPGVYFRVLREGTIEAAADVELTLREPNQVSVLDAWELIMHGRTSAELARRALAIPGLNAKLREKFQRFI